MPVTEKSAIKAGGQSFEILKHLRRGRKITAVEALQLFGCMRLAARIAELRTRGYVIESEWIQTSTGKKVARYFMAKANR